MHTCCILPSQVVQVVCLPAGFATEALYTFLISALRARDTPTNTGRMVNIVLNGNFLLFFFYPKIIFGPMG